MTFIEQQQMTVTLFCICIFVQFYFSRSTFFSYLNIIFNISAGALGQTSRHSLGVNAVCTEENNFSNHISFVFFFFFFRISRFASIEVQKWLHLIRVEMFEIIRLSARSTATPLKDIDGSLNQ